MQKITVIRQPLQDRTCTELVRNPDTGLHDSRCGKPAVVMLDSGSTQSACLEHAASALAHSSLGDIVFPTDTDKFIVLFGFMNVLRAWISEHFAPSTEKPLVKKP